mmetsp:Transcript_17371/g.45144  ORF Transcript_17371/g.45144 Transcript_17371/m.45144 type:complete len:213 (+) Transcript_17371:895-1533(+)
MTSRAWRSHSAVCTASSRSDLARSTRSISSVSMRRTVGRRSTCNPSREACPSSGNCPDPAELAADVPGMAPLAGADVRSLPALLECSAASLASSLSPAELPGAEEVDASSAAPLPSAPLPACLPNCPAAAPSSRNCASSREQLIWRSPSSAHSHCSRSRRRLSIWSTLLFIRYSVRLEGASLPFISAGIFALSEACSRRKSLNRRSTLRVLG